jgi:hypothetical protein
MRINATDEEVVKYIRTIKLDGKRVATALEVDTEEGWIDVVVPKVKSAKSFRAGETVDISNDDEGQFEFDFERKRIFGKVEVVWHDDTPTQVKAAGVVG